MSAFSEDSRVKFPTILHLMKMGFEYVSQKGLRTSHFDVPKVESDPLTNILTDYFREAYQRLNPKAQEGDFEKMLNRIQKALNNDDLGREFYKKILLETGERIIDLSSATNFARNNTFQVATEMTCGNKDGDNFRPDITLFVNGLPLAFIEVKKENNHKGIQAETERMKRRFETPAFRRYLNITQIMVFSNDMEYDNEEVTPTIGAFYATIGKHTTKYNCFREEGQNSFPKDLVYRILNDKEEEILLRDNNVPQYKHSQEYKTNCINNTPTKRICESLFSFSRFHFFLKYGLAYVDDPKGLQKHIMRYPQVFATKAIHNYLESGRTKGIIWHTQGSGKTALSYFNVKYLTDYYSAKGIIPQFFFIVDRLDLMQQAQLVFSYRGLKVNIVQSREDFAKLISSTNTTQNTSGEPEITVVNIQKFSNDSRALPKNAYDVKVQRIYFIDEAHRDYSPDGCFLKNLVSSDTNAIKIALTGTPIISHEYNTKDIFGDYIHTYFYNASISDGYTLRLIREDITSNYKIKLKEALEALRVKYGSLSEGTIYARKSYVQPLLDYVVKDFHDFRIKQDDRTLGAMVVCNSREQAELLYDLFLEKYADETEIETYTDEYGQIKYRSKSAGEIEVKKSPCAKGRYRAAIITYSSYNSKEERAQWIDLFKNGKVDFLIVFQMLQTGFDAPRLKKLYLHRMVKEHNLLQTLTRVNRPYRGMKYGYVVDFANIEEAYSKTSKDYQEELENEVGQDHMSETDHLLISLEEAQQQVTEASAVLSDFDLSNAQVFSMQLNVEQDKEKVRSVLKSLETLRSLENMLIAQGTDAKELISTENLRDFVKAARSRLDMLNFLDGPDENTRQQINQAIENIQFTFEKQGEGELELMEQFRQTMLQTKQEITACVDQDDPEYVSLLEELRRLFKKKQMEESTEFNLHESMQNVRDILKRIKRLNQLDQIEAVKYKGDTKFVRVAKRLKEKEHSEEQQEPSSRHYHWVADQQRMTMILLAIKDDVDDVCYHSRDLISVPEVFTRKILAFVSRRFNDAAIHTDREVRRYVSDIINREYQIIA